MPVLSFPSVHLLGITVRELISDSDMQAKGMKMVADRVPSAASVSLMDLSVEAEAFGSTIRVSDDEVPTVIGALVTSEEEADALKVPEVGAARTGLYVEAIAKACKLITDRPVFAGVIGPFSLAGRLMDVTEALVNCYTEPDMVHKTMEKATEFLIQYCLAYKATGASGIVMAEPLTGLLSPDMAAEFSDWSGNSAAKSAYGSRSGATPETMARAAMIPAASPTAAMAGIIRIAYPRE